MGHTGVGRGMRLLWSEYAMDLASVASRRSEDPYIKVGACVLRHDNSIGGLGYNGPPPKVNINWGDRDERRKRVIHAEVNALRYVRPGECRVLACTLMPCNDCLRTIASYGIREVIYGEIYERDNSTADLAKEFGIRLRFDSRRERFDQICS